MKVVWSKRALTDLREIRDWIATDSPCYAFRLTERIVEAVESLEIMPRRGHAVPEARHSNILEIHLEPYRIIYNVSFESISVLTIVHMARNVGILHDDNEG